MFFIPIHSSVVQSLEQYSHTYCEVGSESSRSQKEEIAELRLTTECFVMTFIFDL